MTDQPMTTAEFREHIRRICRGPEAQNVNAPRKSDPCVVRTETDRGYKPPKRKETNQ